MSSGLLAKRSRAEIASEMMKKIRRQIRKAPAYKPPRKGRNIEGVVNGVVRSGSDAPEIKNLDVNVSNTAVVTGTPYILSMSSALAEGVQGANRISLKVQFKSWDCRMNIVGMVNGALANPTNAAACSPCFVDVFYVWDKQPNGATPSVSTIFTTTTTPLTFGNVGQLERFVVLRRKRYVLDSAQALAYVDQEHVPLDLSTKFPDATGSPNTNDVYIVAICNNAAAAATLNAGISFSARMKFTDA